MKVVLILVDGMRPDALQNVEKAQQMMKTSAYTMDAQTVMPSMTLPCHMSLFHSVDPARHGTATNVYAPQVRPINGMCEVLRKNGKKSAFFYNWEELRDLSRPQSLCYSYFCNQYDFGYAESNVRVADAAAEYLSENDTDFTFVYLGETDEVGHDSGWMSEAYLDAVKRSWDLIDKIAGALNEDDVLIVTADHGGHERTHGHDVPEDMTIPLIIHGSGFAGGAPLENASIKDIAPTIVKLLNTEPDMAWEGKSLF